MSELIDRQDAIDKICDFECGCKLSGCPILGEDSDDYCDHIRILMEQPTIEPEVRHGEWVETESDEDDRKIGIEFSIKCSKCHDENSHLDFNDNDEITGKTFWKSRYCPNCGAKMDGGAESG